MFGHANTYKKKLDKIENDEEELKKELRKVRNCYNACHNLSSGFVISFFLAFFGYLIKVNEIEDSLKYGFIAAVFLIILIYQILFVKFSNFYYEKMKIVEDKLEKIEESKSKCEEMKALEAELNEMKLIKAELEKINNAIQNRA